MIKWCRLSHDRGTASWGLSGCMALMLGACFGGTFAHGLPCESDDDCGPQLSCDDGLCGGVGHESVCGNSLLEASEECDDGNVDDGDGCTPACTLSVCGDGFLAPGEACDDGNTDDDDLCTSSCQLPSECGNGLAEPGEDCDDGNDDDNDGCLSNCTLPVCGDGVVSQGEQCDDGNGDNTDDCTSTCALPSCGDGFVQIGEVCDDGNEVETDACATTCTISPETPSLELGLAPIKQFEFGWTSVVGAEFYQLLERTEQGEEFVQVGPDLLGESFSLTTPLHLRADAAYMLRACNRVNCADSAEVDVVGTMVDAVGYFKASNADVADRFGDRLALSDDGSTLAVGAPYEDSSATGIDGDELDNSGADSGAVYVFALDGESWSQQAYIKASDTEFNDQFWNISLALSSDGDTLVVGAPRKEAVYVFTRAGESWSQQAYLQASNQYGEDGFGVSVDLSDDGDTLAVGAKFEASGATGVGGDQNDNSKPDAGAVYVFTRTGETWSQQSYIKASNTGSGDRFGDVKLSGAGDTLAVGASSEDSGATTQAPWASSISSCPSPQPA